MRSGAAVPGNCELFSTQCQLEASSNKLGWIHRQAEFRECAQAGDAAPSRVMLSK
jgi:hypothetical protein